MVNALRRRIEARLDAGAVRAAAPAPPAAWALVPLLWMAPILRPAGLPIEVAVPETVAPDAAAESPVISVPSAGEVAAIADAGTRAAAQPNAPDGGPTPTSDGGPGGGEVAVRTEVGGEGNRAGDRRSVPITAERIGLSPDTAAGIWLARAGGEALPGLAPRATAPIRGRTPAEEDISDPARPFEPRYRPLIAAWFQRGK